MGTFITITISSESRTNWRLIPLILWLVTKWQSLSASQPCPLVQARRTLHTVSGKRRYYQTWKTHSPTT